MGVALRGGARGRRSAATLALALAVALAVSAFAGGARANGQTAACIRASDDGQKNRDEGKLRHARADLLSCARDACPALIRSDCARWLADVETRTPTIMVRARDEAGREVFDVAVSVDGETHAARLDGRLIPVDPGEHVLRFVRADGSAAEQATTIREGEKARTIEVRLARTAGVAPAVAASPPRPAEPDSGDRGSPSGPSLVLPAALGGVAIAGGIVFAVMASSAKSDVDAMRATCAPGCASADVEAARTRLLVANVSLGVGVAALGAAVVAYMLGRPAAATTTALGLAPATIGRGAVGSLSRSF